MEKPIKRDTVMQEISGVNNTDQNPFTSNGQTIHHQPDKFVLDFQSIYPQFVNNQPIMVMNHRVILLESYVAKEFLRALKENIDNYKKKLGMIKKSEAMVKAEKEIKNLQKETITATAEKPSYTG